MHRSCTIQTPNPKLARQNGALELGVSADAVELTRTGKDAFRVEVVEAPFLLELEVEGGNQAVLVKRAMGHVGDFPPLTTEVITRHLAELGVVFGVIDRAIKDVVERIYESGPLRDVRIAVGEPPVAGTPDAVTLRAVPGTTVRDGTELAVCDLEGMGREGRDVLGQTLSAPGRPALHPGEGVEQEADGARWVARVPGCGLLHRDADSELSVTPAVTIAEDRLSASLELRGALDAEDRLSFEEVRAAVAASGVVEGIDEQALASAWARYDAGEDVGPVVIARGRAPIQGQDGEFVPSESARVIAAHEAEERDAGDLRPAEEQVDHRELHRFHGVSADGVAGHWQPPGRGEDGIGVDGSVLAAPLGDGTAPAAGESLTDHPLEEGVIEYRAEIDGVLVFEEGRVSVKDLLEVHGDVEYDTGNIDVDGSLFVHGRVRSGFRVTAGHDLAVSGSIENAEVEVGGSLHAGRGILGGEGGSITVGKDLSAGYTQNARIRCGGDMEIRQSDANSDIRCGGKLTAVQGRGSLRSGRYVAAGGLEVLELGSELSAPTKVTVGANPELLEEARAIADQLKQLRNAKRAAEAEYEALQASSEEEGMDHEKAAHFRALLRAKTERRKRVKELLTRQEEIRATVYASDPPQVEVHRCVHQNVTIRILDAVVECEGYDTGVVFRYNAEEHRIEVLPLVSEI